MLKRFFIIALAAMAVTTAVCAAAETVYLKNGSVIKGEVIEQVPGKSIKVQTKDGSIFVYEMDQVEKITKESASSAPAGADCNVRHRKLDFSLSTGYNIATKGGSGSVPVDFTLSKRFSPYFAAGIGAGVDIGTASGSKPIIPIFASFKGFMPLSSSKVTPFADVKLGYGINTADDIVVGSGKYRTEVKMPNYFVFSVMPGVRLPLSSTADIDLGVGYQHMVASGGGYGAVMFKVGFNFHANQDPNRIIKPKKVVPVYDSGLELGFELGGMSDWNGALILGYKWSPKLSFGLGFSYGAAELSNYDYKATYYNEPGGKGDVIKEKDGESYNDGDWREAFKVFLRAQYRLNDNKFSPIASVDLGYRKNGGDAITYYNSYLNQEIEFATGLKDQISCKAGGGFFVRPMVGVSLRIGSNSYLEAKVGGEITNGIGKVDETFDKKPLWNSKLESVRVEKGGQNFSNFAFSLGWKHTFSLGGR